MKKWCLLCLCLVLLGSMTACKKKVAEENSTPTTSEPTQESLPPTADNGNELVWDEDGLTPATTTTTKNGSTAGKNNNSTAGKDNGSTAGTTTSNQTPATTPTTTPMKEVDGILLPAEGSKPLPETDPGYKWLELGKSSHSNGVASLVVKNTSKGWETEQEKSFLSYVCYDKNDKELKRDKVNFGRIRAGESATAQITMPAGTAKLAIYGAETEFWTQGWR